MRDEATDRIPAPILFATTLNQTMGELVLEFERADPDARYARYAATGEGLERILGHFVPAFQRPAVWSREQSVAFVENAWRGVHLGTYVVNSAQRVDRRTGLWNRLDRLLIDGQQRVRAIDAYLRGEFPVFGLTWAELTSAERWRFENIPFAKSVIAETDEAKLRVLYDCLNFGGTAHREEQRATARPAEPGLAKSYRGAAAGYVVDLAEEADGSWSASFAVEGAWDGRDDARGTLPTEADALAAFRALRDRNILPRFADADRATDEADHAP